MFFLEVLLEQQKLLASDAATSDYFGISVSIDGDTAIVGASGDDDNGGDSGSVYVYQETAATTGPEITVTDSIGVNNALLMPFGNVTVGTSSTGTATISNVGTVALNVSGIQLTGADTGEYTLDLNGGTSPCGSATPTVPAGTNCTVTITFSPTSTGLIASTCSYFQFLMSLMNDNPLHKDKEVPAVSKNAVSGLID